MNSVRRLDPSEVGKCEPMVEFQGNCETTGGRWREMVQNKLSNSYWVRGPCSVLKPLALTSCLPLAECTPDDFCIRIMGLIFEISPMISTYKTLHCAMQNYECLLELKRPELIATVFYLWWASDKQSILPYWSITSDSIAILYWLDRF